MTITLLWKYIHYDVDQLTWRYGKTHMADEENKEVSQTNLNESDTNLVLRWAVTGTARLRRILSDYISGKTENANDTLPTEKTSWGFIFNDDVTADGHALAELMHWFVVRWCVYQWCLAFAPDQALLEKRSMDDIKTDLEKVLGGGDSAMPVKESLTRIDDELSDEIEITYEPDEP